MFSFTLGAAALALAASGTPAQNSDQPEANGATSQDGQQRGASERTDKAPSPATDLRGLRDAGREAQVVAEIVADPARREARQSPQAKFARTNSSQSNSSGANSPGVNSSGAVVARPAPATRGNSGLRDPSSRQGTDRVRERIATGPLDRSVRMLARCPPGLARNGSCTPPGLAKPPSNQRDSMFGRDYSPLLFGLTGFDAGRYLYRDGYLMQLATGAADGNRVMGYIPLLGGALASGNIWPGSYGSQSVPAYLVDFYNLGQPGSYRYADNTLYRIDPQSAAIQSVAALLTDEEVAVGEPMPAGYDVYNVPYPYQNRYADSAEAAYRYVDGYVYRLDPATRLVTAVIDLLT